jgi:hypothetical protein
MVSLYCWWVLERDLLAKVANSSAGVGCWVLVTDQASLLCNFRGTWKSACPQTKMIGAFLINRLTHLLRFLISENDTSLYLEASSRNSRLSLKTQNYYEVLRICFPNLSNQPISLHLYYMHSNPSHLCLFPKQLRWPWNRLRVTTLIPFNLFSIWQP